MKWITILYNNVQQKVMEFNVLASSEPLSQSFFDNLSINGELTGFFISTHRLDPCRWDKKKGEWVQDLAAPDEVKLMRLLLE